MKKRYYNIWWGVWLAILIGAGISILIAVWQSRAFADEYNHTKAPAEPTPSKALEWEAHRSLGVIVRYEIGGLSIWFSHPVQQRRVARECGPVYILDDIMYFTTVSQAPMRYETGAEATGYKWAGDPFWTPLILKSYYGKR